MNFSNDFKMKEKILIFCRKTTYVNFIPGGNTFILQEI